MSSVQFWGISDIWSSDRSWARVPSPQAGTDPKHLRFGARHGPDIPDNPWSHTVLNTLVTLTPFATTPYY